MNKSEKAFQKIVTDYYRTSGRHNLPWKKTKDPYKILVSEIMLQQTQVERVLPKYTEFIKKWPTAKRLAAAPLSEVLKVWQGLGYNRRAKLLHECVKTIVGEYGSTWPREYEELKKLPGIGPYTAGAVMAFAFNKAAPIIETNIRTAYLHHFFVSKTDVSESDLMKLIKKTLDHDNPREWYYALMDYGSHLKKTVGNLNKQAKSYQTQSTFKGSDREIRGAIIRALSEKGRTLQSLQKLGFKKERLVAQLTSLEKEAMIKKDNRVYRLP